jgi:flagellar biosynthesis protein FlhA
MNARATVATFGEFARNGLGVPVLVMVVLAMMVLPLPAFLLDVFFTFNISLSIMILLAVIYVRRALEFATFPTVLLGDAAAPGAQRRLDAHRADQRPYRSARRGPRDRGLRRIRGRRQLRGRHGGVHRARHHQLRGDHQGRRTHLGSQRALHPGRHAGRQMAIDADLNAGIITQAEAIVRRQEVREEADFYGAMDGASKFVRGDAIAGILIVFINLFGGTIIGAAQHGMSLADAGAPMRCSPSATDWWRRSRRCCCRWRSPSWSRACRGRMT